MEIVADHGACEGHGMCEAMAHDYFALDEDGVVEVLDPTPRDADRDLVESAVSSCPVAALRLLG